MSRNLESPDSDRFTEEFGATVARDATEDVWVIDFKEVTGEDLTFSYSPTDASVRVQLCDDQETLVDIFREGAIQLRIESKRGNSSIVVEFNDGVTSGELIVQIFPRIKITDRMLFR
ncbi:hypothetical protein OG775_37250 [Streptomyces platensis]|uniref:hypothetical protein n=1 Tax=Streptomyces platensis TaxID=58346 RepID=UPI00225A55DF|nr:hypothetical protein [Streptomyces platensis]MCX4640687.1 hypothetical protein [Streptomyces platensis]